MQIHVVCLKDLRSWELKGPFPREGGDYYQVHYQLPPANRDLFLRYFAFITDIRVDGDEIIKSSLEINEKTIISKEAGFHLKEALPRSAISYADIKIHVDFLAGTNPVISYRPLLVSSQEECQVMYIRFLWKLNDVEYIFRDGGIIEEEITVSDIIAQKNVENFYYKLLLDEFYDKLSLGAQIHFVLAQRRWIKRLWEPNSTIVTKIMNDSQAIYKTQLGI